jgi:hypothetical protein
VPAGSRASRTIPAESTEERRWTVPVGLARCGCGPAAILCVREGSDLAPATAGCAVAVPRRLGGSARACAHGRYRPACRVSLHPLPHWRGVLAPAAAPASAPGPASPTPDPLAPALPMMAALTGPCPTALAVVRLAGSAVGAPSAPAARVVAVPRSPQARPAASAMHHTACTHCRSLPAHRNSDTASAPLPSPAHGRTATTAIHAGTSPIQARAHRLYTLNRCSARRVATPNLLAALLAHFLLSFSAG